MGFELLKRFHAVVVESPAVLDVSTALESGSRSIAQSAGQVSERVTCWTRATLYVVLAERRAMTLTTYLPHFLMRAYTHAQSTHVYCRFPCWQNALPSHFLHDALSILCSHISAPPHSTHRLGRFSCWHFLRTLGMVVQIQPELGPSSSPVFEKNHFADTPSSYLRCLFCKLTFSAQGFSDRIT